MHLKRKKATEILSRLSALLEKKPTKLDEDDVHHIRTNTRKTETLLDTLPAKLRKRAKLDSKLKKLRRRAGAVRDADVQIGLLHGLSLHSAPTSAVEQKEHLIHALHLQRAMGMGRLENFLKKNNSGVRARLGALHHDLPKNQISVDDAEDKGNDTGDEAYQEAVRRFRALAGEYSVLHPDNLHDFRKCCKHIRYLAEMGNETPESKHFAEQLTTLQDAIGAWHDWQTLHCLAFRLGMHHELLAITQTLEEMERHKYAEAIRVAERTIESYTPAHKTPARKKSSARPALRIVHRTPVSISA